MSKTHSLSFAPVKHSGKGRGRKFGFNDEQWNELYEATKDLKGNAKAQLLKEYDVSYKAILNNTGNVEEPSTSSKSPARSTPTATREEALTALEDQIKEMQETLKGLENTRDIIKGLDDAGFKAISTLMKG